LYFRQSERLKLTQTKVTKNRKRVIFDKENFFIITFNML